MTKNINTLILKKLTNNGVIPKSFGDFNLLKSSNNSMLFYNQETDDVVYVYFTYGKVETENYQYNDVIKYVSFVETKNRFFKCFNFRKSAYPVLEYRLKSIGLSFSFHNRHNWGQDNYMAIKFDNPADEAAFRLYYAEKICTPEEYRNKTGRY